jgi:FkbM family methyltransferase
MPETALVIPCRTSLQMQRSTILRTIAPKVFWRHQFSNLQQQFGEQELYIVPFLCDKAKTSIDVGASEGVYTVHMISRSRDCFAFEPRHAQAAELEEMFRYLSLPVRVEAVALSDTGGDTTLRILERDVGRSTIEPDNPLVDLDGSASLEVTVPRRRLDDYELDVVGFVKIDVEGHELSVLRGSAETIRRCRPALLIEIEERHKPNAIHRVSKFLAEFGYNGYFILQHDLIPLTHFQITRYQNSENVGGWKNDWQRSGIYINNFFFVHDELKSFLEAAVIRVQEDLAV